MKMATKVYCMQTFFIVFPITILSTILVCHPIFADSNFDRIVASLKQCQTHYWCMCVAIATDSMLRNDLIH